MNRKENIQNELMNISSSVAEIPFVNIFLVPYNYFETLTKEITFQLNNSNIYTVPNSYFNDLTNSILQKTISENNENELEDIAPTLASISKVNVYSTQNNYFENIEINKDYNEAKLISIKQTKKNSLFKYSVAACLIVIAGLFAERYLNSSITNKADQIIAGTKFSFKEIENVNVDAALDSVNVAELDNYLCENNLVVCNQQKVDDDLQKQLDNLNISDSDLDNLINDTN